MLQSDNEGAVGGLENIQYLSQDISWNGNGEYHLTLDASFLSEEIAIGLNEHWEYVSAETMSVATAQHSNISTIIHCSCKQGSPADSMRLRICSGGVVHITWPGVTRIFVRIRIMEAIPLQTMRNILIDDIESGHSVSDVEAPDANQSFRPWSDQDDSETVTASEHCSSRSSS